MFELKNMDDVLHEPLVRESLDDTLWSFLKVLYTDKRGINLRNLVAHGVAPSEAFNPVNAGLVVQSVVLLSIFGLRLYMCRTIPPLDRTGTAEC